MSGSAAASASFFSPRSLLTQTVPSSREKYHFSLCVRLVKHTIQEDTIYLSSASFFSPVWSLTAPTRGQTHNHSRISADNHCGAAGKCCKSKQRKCVCTFVCTCVLYMHFPLQVCKCSYMDACFVSAATSRW